MQVSDVNKSLFIISAKSYISKSIHTCTNKYLTFFSGFCHFKFLSRVSVSYLIIIIITLICIVKTIFTSLAMIFVHVIILNIYRSVSWMNVVLKCRENNKKVSLVALYRSLQFQLRICMEKVSTRNHVRSDFCSNMTLFCDCLNKNEVTNKVCLDFINAFKV